MIQKNKKNLLYIFSTLPTDSKNHNYLAHSKVYTPTNRVRRRRAAPISSSLASRW